MNAQQFITKKNPFEEHRELSRAMLSAFLLHWFVANAALSLSFRLVKWLFLKCLFLDRISAMWYWWAKPAALLWDKSVTALLSLQRLMQRVWNQTLLSLRLLHINFWSPVKVHRKIVTLRICYIWNNTAHGSEPELRTCTAKQGAHAHL